MLMSRLSILRFNSILRPFCLKNNLVNPPLWLLCLTTVALLSFSLFGMINDPVSKYSLRLVGLGGFAIWLFYGAHFRNSLLTCLLGAAIAIPLVSWWGTYIDYPLLAEFSPKVHRLTNWFLFIPIAVILGGRIKNVMLVFLLALCGAISASFVSGSGWQEWLLGFKGIRTDFGLHNAQHAALLYGTCLLGLVSFAGRFFGTKNRWRLIRLLLWVAAFLLCSFAVIFSQSRGIWLGLIGASALYLPCVLFYSQLRKRNPKRFWLILVLCVLTGFCLVWSLDSMNSIVSSRFATESGNVQRFFSSDKSGLESTSIGVRLISWSTAWSWIKKRPLIGWGGEGRHLVMEDSGIPGKYGHLHSSYLDLLVSYGVLGGLLFFFLIWWLLNRSLQVWREGGVPVDLLLFFWLFIAFWLIVNFFESYMFFSSGIYIFNIVCGAILTHVWQHDCQKDKVNVQFSK